MDFSKPEFLWFVGWVYGDGSLNKHKPWITIAQKDEAKEVLFKLKDIVDIGKIRPHCNSAHILQIYSSPLYHELSRWGLYPNKSKTIRLDKKIMRLNEIKKAHFIRGLFEADGCVYINDGELKNKARLLLTSGNKDFLKDIIPLLESIGLHRHKKITQNKGAIGQSFTLKINDQRDILRFYNKCYRNTPLEYTLDYKREKFERWLPYWNNHRTISDEELQFVKDTYLHRTDKQIAKALNRFYMSISRIRRKNGFIKLHRWTPKEEHYLLQNKNKPHAELAKLFGVSIHSIGNKLYRLALKDFMEAYDGRG